MALKRRRDNQRPAPPSIARVRELFERLLGEDPSRREALLDEACGPDVALRQEVLSVLDAAARAGDFLSVPARWEPPESTAREPGPAAASGASMGSGTAAGDADAVPRLFSAGEELAGRYRIVRFMGRGGMGEVYEAEDRDLGTRVALKTIRHGVTSRPESLARFKREVLLARRVTHPNVCRVFDLGRHATATGDALFLTMELLEGESLSSRLRSRGRLAPAGAHALLGQIAAALDAAHRAGVIHRDLKPGNVLLVPEPGGERAVVTDFGLAGDERSGDGTHGEAGIVGTPAYMAAEQLTGGRVGPRADVYALGVILFEALTGALPFRGESTIAIALARLTETPPKASSIVAELDPRWDAAILRCLARDPAERFASAGEVAAFLAGTVEAHDARVAFAGSLPAESDAFVGRDRELREIEARLAGSGRLLTLVGSAGTGKTRLAIRHASRSRESWPGGTWFCDVTDARGAEGIAAALARTMDVPPAKGDAVLQQGHAIAGRGRCLIVLDGFEPVASHAEATVGAWRERAKDAAFLVTSRERLRLDGEDVLDVEPLAEDDGVALFLARARSHRREAGTSPWDMEEIRLIVQRLDGLPLAIELAAARVRLMSPKQVAARIAERFRLLAGGAAGGRHATLRAAIDASWELLAPWEKSAFAQASVFEGGMTLEAAEAVLDLSAWPEAPWIVDAVQSLVDRSLLRIEGVATVDAAEPAPRVRILSSLQAYSREKLGAEERHAAEARHGRHFARLGTSEAVADLDRHGGALKRRALARDLDNVVAACRRGTAQGDAESAVDLYRAAWEVLELRGPFATAMEIGRDMLAIESWPDASRSEIRRVLGNACWRASKHQDALALYDEALALARRCRDRRAEGVLLGNLGNVHYALGRIAEARDFHAQALAIHREVGNRRHEGIALASLANMDLEQGNPEVARRQYEHCVAIAREIGDRRSEGITLGNLGYLHFEQGRMGEAGEHFDRALAIHREVGNRRFEGEVLGSLAGVHLEQGRIDEARKYLEAALAVARATGDRRAEGASLGNLGLVSLELSRFAEARERLEAALAIHREVGNRSFEGHVLGRLGEVHLEQGRLDAARESLEAALPIHRELGDVRDEGQVLARLGELEARSGNGETAHEHFAAGEAMLRERGYRVELGGLLCARGTAAAGAGDLTTARACLAEADALAESVGAGPESAAGRALRKLREAIAGRERQAP